MLNDIWQWHSDAELEVTEEDYVRLFEEAKRFADEPVCQAAMRLFPVLWEFLDVIRVGAKWDWPEVRPVELVHLELARRHQAAQEPTKVARQQNA